MKGLASLAVLALALAAAPVALAQDEPAVNESDFDTSAPPADDSYLDEEEDLQTTSADDEPTVAESDFDTSAPASDTSYLDDEQDLAGTEADDGAADPAADPPANGLAPDAPAKKTPGPALALGLAVLGVAALARGRRA